MPVRPLLLAALIVALLPEPVSGQFSEEERERLFGAHTYDSSVVIARRLADVQPAIEWARSIQGEAADLIEFLSDDRVLVGMIDVSGRGSPSHGRLFLVDAASGDVLWDHDRDNLSGGSYTLLHDEPHLILLGANDERLQLTALDPASGRTVWDAAMDAPFDVALAPEQGRLVVAFRDGDRWTLRALGVANGDRLWETRLDEHFRADASPKLDLAGDTVFVLAGSVVEVGLADGVTGRVMAGPGVGRDEGTGFRVRDGFVVWDERIAGRVDRARGESLWTADGIKGAIRTVVMTGGYLFVVSGGEGLGRVSLLDPETGAVRWSRSGGTIVSPLAVQDGMILFTTDSLLVGLNVETGASDVLTALPPEMPDGSPTFAPVMGMPDVLRTSAGRIFVARERAGLAAIDLPSGTLAWYRPHYEANVAILNYTGEGRFAYVLDALATTRRIQSLDDIGQLPPSLSRGSGGAGPLVRAAQRDYEEARRRYEAGRTDASAVRSAAELAIAATQIDIAMGQMQAGVELARAIIGVGQAIRAAMQRAAEQGLIDRAQLAMQGALRLQHRLFQPGYYVRPFYLEGTGRGVTVIDTATGLRRDVIFSPHSMGHIAFGLDMPTFGVSPDGERLLAVGVSLRPETWERRDKWDTRVPDVSLLSYDLTALEFVDGMTVFFDLMDAVARQSIAAVRTLLGQGADVNTTEPTHGMTPLHLAASSGNAALVRLLLEHGADVNARSTQGYTPLDAATAHPEVREILVEAGGETGIDPTAAPPPAPAGPVMPPLGMAALSGNIDRVRELLAEGADPNHVSEDGETALHYAVAVDRADIVALLLEAGADPTIRSNTGQRPIDFARSDAVREALEGR